MRVWCHHPLARRLVQHLRSVGVSRQRQRVLLPFLEEHQEEARLCLLLARQLHELPSSASAPRSRAPRRGSPWLRSRRCICSPCWHAVDRGVSSSRRPLICSFSRFMAGLFVRHALCERRSRSSSRRLYSDVVADSVGSCTPMFRYRLVAVCRVVQVTVQRAHHVQRCVSTSTRRCSYWLPICMSRCRSISAGRSVPPPACTVPLLLLQCSAPGR